MRIIVGKNVVLTGQEDSQPATLVINPETGKIVAVHKSLSTRDEYPGVSDGDWVDAGDSIVMPGLVDAHVHLNEPGRTDWEGFWTGTRAAASGGVTMLVDMPLNSIPPTTTVAHLEAKRAAARGQCWTDVAFWGGVIPGNQAELKPLVEAGVRGFKCFLIESGVEEFPCVTEHDVKLAMEELEGTSTVLMFHAELEAHPPPSTTDTSAPDPTLYSTFLASRPPQLEIDAIALITRLHAQHPSLRLHIVHLAASAALPLVRAAHAAGRPLTAETCFHYLALAAADVPRGRPEFKCCPPVREAANREALWDALKDETVACVVSDHSPCVAGLKCCETGDVMSAWGGISTLGLGLSLLWTEGRKRGVGMGRIVEWVCGATARHAGFQDRKGRLEVGYDADVVIFDPDTEFKVTKELLKFKNKLTPYEGLTLRGRVEKTFLRGSLVYDVGRGFMGEKAPGMLL